MDPRAKQSQHKNRWLKKSTWYTSCLLLLISTGVTFAAPNKFIIAKSLNWIPQSGCNLCEGYYQEPAELKKIPHPLPIKDVTTRITAAGPTIFKKQGVSILTKNVVVTQPGRIIKADRAYIYRNSKTGKITRVKLVGHVHLIEHGKLIVSHEAWLHLTDHTYLLRQVIYHINEKTLAHPSKKLHYDAWGTASLIKHLASDVMEFWHATYSTCSPLNPVWEIHAARLILNHETGMGVAKNAVITFKKIPIFYAPYYTFPINDQRKTGFLAPYFGQGSDNGFDLNLPFYLNLAPNYDALITPRLMTKRGVQGNLLFRYLTHHNEGHAFVSFLPDDREFENFKNQQIQQNANNTSLQPYVNALKQDSNNRGYFSFDNHSQFGPRWSADVILNYVTDAYYFNDFGNTGQEAVANQLLNQVDITYLGEHWQLLGLIQAYQSLHTLYNVGNVFNQYTRLPEFDISGSYPNFFKNFNFFLSGQSVNFIYNSTFFPTTRMRPIGERIHLRPGLSYALNWASAYLTPAIMLDSTTYFAELPTNNGPRPSFNETRVLPIIDLDSGLYLDRHFAWGGHEYLQTLQPRFFYLYVPYENQNAFPIFDTQIEPFTYEDLFALNRFTGFDRLENANQVSFGLSSEILDAETGAEKLNIGFGFIYYITSPQVNLPVSDFTQPDPTIVNRHISPLVSQVTFYPWEHWSTTGSIAYDTEYSDVNNADATIAYQRDPQHIFAFGYQFIHKSPSEPSTVHNADLFHVGFTWPLTSRWGALGYFYYNIGDSHIQTYSAGLQYDTCCWAIRFIAARVFTGTLTNNNVLTNQFRSAYYVQLLLKGLGTVGNSSPTAMLLSDLPGYQDPFQN